jgi:cell division protein FtsB
MSKNRKNQSAAIRFAPALKAVLLCAFLGGSSIGYVWQKNQLIDLGRRIKEREASLAQLREANLKLSKQLATLRSPAYLERRLKELNLPLTLPAQSQILRLVETSAGEAAAARDSMLAGRGPGGSPGAR